MILHETGNGCTLPPVGLGTWQINDKALMRSLLEAAYSKGYRLIDTAAAYSNEMIIGKALTESGIPREELILSDKVWNTCRTYDGVQKACEASLRKLKTDYLDMYLVHWPASPKVHEVWREINADTWRGMEALYNRGLVKAIGVCNFKKHHLVELEKTAEIFPMVNQLEFHPGMMQTETVDYCRSKRIALEASSPLGNGQLLENENLKQIAVKYGHSTAQICLRWAVQHGLTVLPKTTHTERLGVNIAIFDFTLAPADMAQIDSMSYCGGLGIDSDEVTEYG